LHGHRDEGRRRAAIRHAASRSLITRHLGISASRHSASRHLGISAFGLSASRHSASRHQLGCPRALARPHAPIATTTLVSAGGRQRHLGTAAPLATSLPPTRLTPPPGALLESLCHEPAVSSIASAATTIANTSLVCAAHHQRSTRRPALHPLVPRQRSRRFPTSFCTPASNPAGASAHRCQLTSTSAPQPPLSNIRSS
jgi:hypothetical protein